MKLLPLLLLSAAPAPAALILSSVRTVAATASSYGCQVVEANGLLGFPVWGGGEFSEVVNESFGAFTHNYHSGNPGPALFGSGAAGQSSFIGADAFIIPSLYAELYGGDTCAWLWASGGVNSATSALSVRFRLAEPVSYSFTGSMRESQYNWVFASLAGADTTLFRHNGGLFSFSGQLQPGDYVFDVNFHLESPPFVLGSGVELYAFARLENAAFVMTPIPEPSTGAFAMVCAWGSVLRRRRQSVQ